jgi:hypothetical protein
VGIRSRARSLTQSEYEGGRFLTAPVTYYKRRAGGVCYASDQHWGLVGLHIIHKTVKFPTFFFASWEHVDNMTSKLNYRNTSSGGPGPTVGKELPYQRVSHFGKKLPSDDVDDVNRCVRNLVRGVNPQSVWQYYQLVGVQGTPVDHDQSEQLKDKLPNYYLANNVIESNDFFQSFRGTKGKYHVPGFPDGTTPGKNVRNTPRKIKDDVGGCQGCHGNSQFQKGYDMSFISAAFANKAEAIDDFDTRSDRGRYLEPNRP